MTTPQERAIAERTEIAEHAGYAFGYMAVCMDLAKDALRAEVKHGPDGEANYAWLYSGDEMLATMKTHHALRLISRIGKGEHFLRYFERLAKVNAAANAALDTARREWAKRGEK